MNRLAKHLYCKLLAAVVCMGLIAGCTTTSAQSNSPRFDQEALDAMVAPIALYPDPLLSQVLMAATYPREVEEAAQWSRARPGLTGDAAVRSSEGWDWDPSVRSLLAFPQVLDTLARYPRWTEDLGDAFLAQPEDVMDTVQHLRRRAYRNGTLRSTDDARVVDTGREILIEPAAPQVVHVPHYDPRVVYGTWWWPGRTPVYWSRWPGYVDHPSRVHVVHWGPGIGVSSGFFFGGFVWPRREVRVVNVNTYYYTRRVVVERPVVVERQVEVRRQPTMSASAARDASPGVWRHDASRRRGTDANDSPRSAGRREPPAPTAARSADVRREPTAAPAPITAVAPAPAVVTPTAPARAPEAAPAERPQRRDPPQRIERTQERDSTPRAERNPEPRMSPSAVNAAPTNRSERRDPVARPAPAPERPATSANTPSPSRAERPAEPVEPRAANNNARERDDQGGRRAHPGGRDNERPDVNNRQTERGRNNGNAEGGRPMSRGGNDRNG